MKNWSQLFTGVLLVRIKVFGPSFSYLLSTTSKNMSVHSLSNVHLPTSSTIRHDGFTSVPIGIYWAISTVTTVGYGDVTPSTPIGRIFASIMMLLGWGVLAVPTGIVGAELSRSVGTKARLKGVDCEVCGLGRHEDDSRYCRRCGSRLVLAGVDRAARPAAAANPHKVAEAEAAEMAG